MGSAPSSRRDPPTWLPFAVAAGVLVVDQVTKAVAVNHLKSSTHLLGPLGLGLTYNSGSAFSLFQGSTRILICFDVVLAFVLAVLSARARHRGLQVGLGLLLGGALGNLADRLVGRHHGRVVDFITLSHWPTFNLADAAIDVGVIVIIVSLLSDRHVIREHQEVGHEG